MSETDETPGNGIDIYGPKGVHVQARGQSALLALLLILGIAGIAYIVHLGHADLVREIDLERQDHKEIKLSEDRMACILTMTQQEREMFRKNWHPGIAASYCPWVEAR